MHSSTRLDAAQSAAEAWPTATFGCASGPLIYRWVAKELMVGELRG